VQLSGALAPFRIELLELRDSCHDSVPPFALWIPYVFRDSRRHEPLLLWPR
jgi:hypothetical protein